MRFYIYKVKDESGRTISGVAEGVNKKMIKKKIARTKYYFISAQAISKKSLFNKKVKFQTLIMFTHRLSTLVEAGIPILQGVEILWRQTEDETIQIVTSRMKSKLEEGNKISDSLSEFPKIFPSVYCALIRVGEMSGVLVEVLRKLSAYLDYKAAMITRTKKATLYPMIVVVFSIVVLFLMFLLVVPVFAKVLTKLRIDLPFLTRAIITIAEVMRTFSFFIIMLCILAFFVFCAKVLMKNQRFSFMVNAGMLRIPYFGNLLRSFALSQFIRSLSILLGAGVPIVESMTIAAHTAGNAKIKQDIEITKNHLEQGTSMYESFKKVKDYPIMLIEMVGIGESSGMLVPILEKVTRHFDEEVDYHLNRFLTYLEPILIILVGVIVITVLLAVYLPLVSIWQGIIS